MPVTLTDEDARLAAEAVDWWVREGIPEQHVRGIALGEIKDERFDRLVALRAELQDLVKERVTIGRVAYDYLNSLGWEDPTIEGVLATAQVGRTRVSIRGTHETLSLLSDISRERANVLLEHNGDAPSAADRLEAKRLVAAARQLAGEVSRDKVG